MRVHPVKAKGEGLGLRVSGLGESGGGGAGNGGAEACRQEEKNVRERGRERELERGPSKREKFTLEVCNPRLHTPECANQNSKPVSHFPGLRILWKNMEPGYGHNMAFARFLGDTSMPHQPLRR